MFLLILLLSKKIFNHCVIIIEIYKIEALNVCRVLAAKIYIASKLTLLKYVSVLYVV